MTRQFNPLRADQIEWPTTKAVHFDASKVAECPFCLSPVLKTRSMAVDVLGTESGAPYFLIYEVTKTPVYFHTRDRCNQRRAEVDKRIAKNREEGRS